MTTVNGSTLPSQLALNPEGSSSNSMGSIISSLANVSPSTVGKFADSAFLSLGKDGVKFLPFLTALVRAFQGKEGGSSGGAQTAGAAGAKLDVGAATKSLINARNDLGNVKGLDAAISKVSQALPNLTQGQFEGLMDSLKAAAAAKPGANGSPGTGEIDSTELGLIQGQINSDTAENTASQASPTGNQALDAVLGSIKDIAADGVSPDETSSLAQVFASLTSALLPADKSDSLMQALGGAFGMPAGPRQGAGGGQISIGINLGGGSGLAGNGGGASLGGLGPAQGFYGGGGSNGARGNTFDGMSFLLQEMQQSASLSNFNPMSTNTLAYNYLLTALQDTANRGTVGTHSAGLNATTM